MSKAPSGMTLILRGGEGAVNAVTRGQFAMACRVQLHRRMLRALHGLVPRTAPHHPTGHPPRSTRVPVDSRDIMAI